MQLLYLRIFIVSLLLYILIVTMLSLTQRPCLRSSLQHRCNNNFRHRDSNSSAAHLPFLKRSEISKITRAQAETDTEAEIFIDIPDPEHIILCDSFPDAPASASTKTTPLISNLRAHFDERFAEPLKTTADRFAWDFWHVTDEDSTIQYSLHRTPADAFFPSDLYDQLEDALVEYGERVLGCRGISPVWLSYYTDGCRQEFHCDNPHGPWAFVLSLTNWDARTFTGGETMLLNPTVLDFWRNFDSSQGLESKQLTTLIAPKFGQLTVFDPRFPHGVRIVEGGNRDPRHGRIVLHGWFTSPTPFFNGALDDALVTPVLNESLGSLYEALGELPPAVGTATVRLTVGPDGKMAGLEFLTNTVMLRPQGCGGDDVDGARMDVLGCICDHLASIQWPESGGNTEITLPFIFE
jgi:hypothetical protein